MQKSIEGKKRQKKRETTTICFSSYNCFFDNCYDTNLSFDSCYDTTNFKKMQY